MREKKIQFNRGFCPRFGRFTQLTYFPPSAALLAVQNQTITSSDALQTTAIWWAEDNWVGSCGVKVE